MLDEFEKLFMLAPGTTHKLTTQKNYHPGDILAGAVYVERAGSRHFGTNACPVFALIGVSHPVIPKPE